MEGSAVVEAEEPRRELSSKLDRARETAVQAWLASMPLGEELGRLRAEMAAAKARLAETAAGIPRLKSLIESADRAAAAGREEEGAKRAAAEELQRRGDRAREVLRRLLTELASAVDAKDGLERRVLVRRQAVRALQMAELAFAAETHALAWSAAAADKLAAGARGDAAHHDVVALPASRHEELWRCVESEERKAEARVEEAEELRRAAKARRAAAVARLEAARSRRREVARLRRRDVEEDGRGEKERSGRPNSWSGRGCFVVVKKLSGFLCHVAKA